MTDPDLKPVGPCNRPHPYRTDVTAYFPAFVRPKRQIAGKFLHYLQEAAVSSKIASVSL